MKLQVIVNDSTLSRLLHLAHLLCVHFYDSLSSFQPDIRIETCARRYGMPDVGISTRVGFLGCPTLISTCYKTFSNNAILSNYPIIMILITNLPDQSAVTFLVSQLTIPVFNRVSIAFADEKKVCKLFVSLWSCQFVDAKDMTKENLKNPSTYGHTTSSACSIPGPTMTNNENVHLALGAQRQDL